MKKKIYIIGIAVILVSFIVLFFVTRTNPILCETHQVKKEPNQVANSVSFELKEEKEISVSLKTSAQVGTVTYILQSEDGELVHQFDSNDNNSTKLTLKPGKYSLRTDSDSFQGKFDVVIRS